MIDTAVVEVRAETLARESSLLEKVRAWEVKTDEDFTALDSFLVSIKEFEKMVEADFAESEDAARATKKAATDALAKIVAQKDAHLAKAAEARREGKQKLAAWETRKAQEREQERARLEAENRKAAEDAKIAAAAEAEKSGDREAATAIMKEPLRIAPVKLSEDTPKRATPLAVRWGAVIGGKRMDGTQTDPLYVLKAIEAAGKVLAKSKAKDAQEAAELLRQAYQDAKYMAYDQVALNRQATATKDALVLGGVAFVSRTV